MAPKSNRVKSKIILSPSGRMGSEVGKYLYLGSSGVSLAAKRGEKYLKAETVVKTQIMDAIEK